MNKIYLLLKPLVFILIPFLITAQNTKNYEWKLYTEVAGIEIFYKYAECHNTEEGIHQELVLLRFINTGPHRMYLTWHAQVYYDSYNITENSKENKFMLSIDGGEVIEGNCELNCPKGLKIFSKFLNYDDKPELIKFELKNIQVNPFI